MKVILLQDIKGVGKKEQIITATDGYAKNYLFPKNLAVEANLANMNILKTKKEILQKKKECEKLEAQNISNKIKEMVLEIKVKAGENGRVFGGVTSKDISENLQKQYNLTIDKKKIIMDSSIKNLGITIVKIKLYEGIIAALKVNVLSA